VSEPADGLPGSSLLRTIRILLGNLVSLLLILPCGLLLGSLVLAFFDPRIPSADSVAKKHEQEVTALARCPCPYCGVVYGLELAVKTRDMHDASFQEVMPDALVDFFDDCYSVLTSFASSDGGQ
jgi:hypothetical protein